MPVRDQARLRQPLPRPLGRARHPTSRQPHASVGRERDPEDCACREESHEGVALGLIVHDPHQRPGLARLRGAVHPRRVSAEAVRRADALHDRPGPVLLQVRHEIHRAVGVVHDVAARRGRGDRDDARPRRPHRHPIDHRRLTRPESDLTPRRSQRGRDRPQRRPRRRSRRQSRPRRTIETLLDLHRAP